MSPLFVNRREICSLIFVLYTFFLQREFAEKVNSNGVKYGNLFDYLGQKAKNGELGDGSELTEAEYRDALLTLEEENVVSLVGHKRKPTIRFV